MCMNNGSVLSLLVRPVSTGITYSCQTARAENSKEGYRADMPVSTRQAEVVVRGTEG